jgi:hypothetical protein
VSRNLDVINARKLFPELKCDADVTEKHLRVARKALAAQIQRRNMPPVAPKAPTMVQIAVQREIARGRRGQS